jgi:hypothetical protein
MAKHKKRIMKEFKLMEISAVDRPAQSHAVATIMKRNAEESIEHTETLVEKRYALSGETNGHTHLVSINEYTMIEGGGETSWHGSSYHTHPFIIEEGGSIKIGEAEGHTHAINATLSEVLKNGLTTDEAINTQFKGKSTKSNATGIGGGHELVEDTTMPKDTNADITPANEVEALKAQLVKANALSTLNDAQKDLYNSLDAANQEIFLTKSNDERNSDIELSKAADPVIYKSLDGEIYLKSDDPRLVAMAKRTDADRAVILEANEKIAKADLEKRAKDTISNLPGKLETHVAILKSIDSIEDASIREEAMAALKAHNASLRKAFTTVGTEEIAKGDLSEGADAVQEMEDLTKSCMEKDGIGYYEAYAKVSEGHPDLYAKAVKG